MFPVRFGSHLLRTVRAPGACRLLHGSLSGPGRPWLLIRPLSPSTCRWYRRWNQHEEDSYERFEGTNHASRHHSRRTWLILAGVGCGGTLYYAIHLERVPISGRVRFMNVGETSERYLAKMAYESMISDVKNQVLPSYHPLSRYVQRVTERLMGAISQLPGVAPIPYTVHVVDSPIVNAVVLPGGQIFVFTGILPLAKNEDALACILAHEISHKLLRHHAERFSLYSLLMYANLGLQFILGGGFGWINDFFLQLAVTLPNSRKTELEADRVGLRLMSLACYNPREAIAFWQRMEEQAGSPRSSRSFEFISTHPSHYARIESISSWIPEALQYRTEAGCDSSIEGFWSRFG